MTEPPGTLAEALIRLQASLPRITKDDAAEVETKSGGKYRYSYANLASIHDAVFPLLAEHGFTWVCRPTIGSAEVFVLAYSLTHVSGQSIEGTYPLPTSGSPQQIGSAITYARRYTLTAVLGIAPAEDDDDAQAAETQAREAREASQWRPPANPRTRKAVRSRDTAGEDDPWAKPLEDTPGSIEDGQRRRIMQLFTRTGITERADRLAYAMSKLDLPELGSSNDLSYQQALALIEHLEGEGNS